MTIFLITTFSLNEIVKYSDLVGEHLCPAFNCYKHAILHSLGHKSLHTLVNHTLKFLQV